MQLPKNSTSVSIFVYIVQDNTGESPGAPKTGLAFGDLTSAYYIRERTVSTPISLVTLAGHAAGYSSGGFVEVDATNAPGLYRLDVPNAAFTSATAVNRVAVYVIPGNNAVAAPVNIDLTPYSAIATLDTLATTLPSLVWAASGKTLSGTITDFDELAAALNDISASDVWNNGTRTLSGTLNDFDELAASLNDISAADVWNNGTRTLSGTLNDFDELAASLNDISASDVWSHGTRDLTDKDGFALSATGLDTIVIETGVTAPEALRAMSAVLAGEVAGMDTNMPAFKGISSATTRVSANTDEDGNRSSVSLNL